MMEPSDDTFRTFHRYNKLVRRRLARPLTCNICQTAFVTGIGEDDQLVLVCYSCDRRITPGQTYIAAVRAVVKEHFVDDDEQEQH